MTFTNEQKDNILFRQKEDNKKKKKKLSLLSRGAIW